METEGKSEVKNTIWKRERKGGSREENMEVGRKKERKEERTYGSK